MKLLIILSLLYGSFLIAESQWDSSAYILSSNGFDSNLLRTTKNPLKLIFFKLSPGVSVVNKNKSENEISFSADAAYRYNIGLNGTDSLDHIVSNNNNYWTANVDLGMKFYKRGHFTPFINNNFSKISYFSKKRAIDKFDNILNVGFITTPFGQALKFRLEYFMNFHKTFFSDGMGLTGEAAEAQDNIGHDIQFGVEWKFLPKTSFIFDVSYGWILHNTAKFSTVDSSPLKGKTGLKGIITPKLSALILLGWNHIFFVDSSYYTGFVTNLELTYKFTKKTGFVLGYEKSVKDVVFAKYLSFHNLYFKMNNKVSNHVFLNLDTRATMNIFSNFNLEGAATGPDSRTDILITVSPSLSYSNKSYRFELKYILDKNITDYKNVINGNTVTYDYIKHQILLNGTYFF